MEELHPDYTINWDDYDEGDYIDQLVYNFNWQKK